MAQHRIHLGDNLPILREIPDGSVDLVYIDPPYNTGRTRRHTRIRTTRDAGGDRTGFAGRRYATVEIGTRSFADVFDDYLGFLEPRLVETRRVLASHGTLYVHLDYRESHYVKVLLDAIFGRERFINEIIWAYDYGGRTRRRWPPKHDTILVYVADPKRYTFDAEAVDRIPYMAPGLAGPAKAARGKLPTDTWWHTIVPTSGRERTGYPTQKPLGVLRRIVAASSRPGDTVLDFFAGSGTTGAACLELGRRFVLVDESPEAIAVMTRRFDGVEGIEWIGCGSCCVDALSPLGNQIPSIPMGGSDESGRIHAVDIAIDRGVLTATIVNPHVEANRGGAIRDAVVAAIDAGRDSTRAVVLDLARVDYINSSGLGALVELHHRVGREVSWIVYRPNDDVIGLLRAVRLDTLFPIVTTASGLRNALA